MLAEFAAAVVVFAQALHDSRGEDMEVDVDVNEGEEADLIPASMVKVKINDIIAQSYPELMNYYQRCVASRHKHFIWTGPAVNIFSRSLGSTAALGFLISENEQMDHPACPILVPDVTSITTVPPAPAASDPIPATTNKRRGTINADDMQGKKRRP